MKRKSPSSSCSSSSSSSCIESPITENNATRKPVKPDNKPKPKTKRVRAKKTPSDNSATSPKSRSSIYRGVTRHRWTGRYEAHLWDKTTWNSIQNKRGRQIYLGAYDNEEDAARTYDLAALKYWGPATILNFPVETYTKELDEMQKLTKEEYLASLRRRSSGFSRGVSKYRGVARHHHNGRWEARIGRVCGNKYLYLGTYSTQEEAAVAYDMAAIEFRGPNAVTNFDISNYADKLKKVQPEVQGRQEEIQVKKEMNPLPLHEVQPYEAHDCEAEEVQTYEAHDHQEDNKHADGADGRQEDTNQADQPSIPKLESIDSIDSEAIIVMDPTEEHEHPWYLCLDTNFNIFQIPDIPLDKGSEVFDYNCFEDDIECIFDVPFDENEIVQEAIPGSVGLVVRDLKGQDVSTSPTSSSLSTTSVCCNI